MTFRQLRLLLAAALAIGVLGVGCTPTAEPSPSPSPPSPTPTENAVERQMRLDFEAAEKSYRTFRAELGRVLRAGGASQPTKVMKATAAGPYLENFADVAQAYKSTDSRETGQERIVWVRRGAYSSESLLLLVCEDSSDVKTYEGDKLVGSGEVRTAELEVRKTGSAWKVYDGKGEEVSSC